jgi:hypothetical protein
VHTCANNVTQHQRKQGALFIVPKVGLENVLDVFRRVDLNHVAEQWERDGPNRPELVVLFFKELVELLAVDGRHQSHVAKEGKGALWLLDVSTAASADGVGTVLEYIVGCEGQEELEAVLTGSMEEDVVVEGGESGGEGHDGWDGGGDERGMKSERGRGRRKSINKKRERKAEGTRKWKRKNSKKRKRTGELVDAQSMYVSTMWVVQDHAYPMCVQKCTRRERECVCVPPGARLSKDRTTGQRGAAAGLLEGGFPGRAAAP